MNAMTPYFSSEPAALFALGTIFGMLIWDLVFELRPGLEQRDIEAAKSYYRGLHTAPKYVAIVLPIAAIYLLGFLGVQALAGNWVDWLGLAAFVVVLALEIVIALPKERQLWKSLGDVESANSEVLARMRGCIRAARNVHLAIGGVLLWLAVRLGMSS